jgi:polar amino acid transport system permease protein
MLSNPIIQFLIDIVTLNGTYKWAYVWGYLFASDVLQGILITLIMAVLAQFIGFLIGLALYFMRRSRLGLLRWLANRYIWFFRGTPLLVQILFLTELFPYLHVSNPLDRTRLFFYLGFTIQVPLASFIPALLALALNEGAYMAEIVRAGIDAIDTGQIEAAKSLGMTYGLAMRRVVLPQAMRVIVPPLGNEFNSMLKSTSLASTVGVTELLAAAHDNHTAFGAPLEFLTIASIWYIVLTTLWGYIQARIERRLNVQNIEPTAGGAREGWWQRLIGIRRGGGAGAPEVALPLPVDHR